jgi:hypothetical protein
MIAEDAEVEAGEPAADATEGTPVTKSKSGVTPQHHRKFFFCALGIAVLLFVCIFTPLYVKDNNGDDSAANIAGADEVEDDTSNNPTSANNNNNSSSSNNNSTTTNSSNNSDTTTTNSSNTTTTNSNVSQTERQYLVKDGPLGYSIPLFGPEVVQGYENADELASDIENVARFLVSSTIQRDDIRYSVVGGGESGDFVVSAPAPAPPLPAVGDSATDYEGNNQEFGIDQGDYIVSDGTHGKPGFHFRTT